MVYEFAFSSVLYRLIHSLIASKQSLFGLGFEIETLVIINTNTRTTLSARVFVVINHVSFDYPVDIPLMFASVLVAATQVKLHIY